MPNRQAQKRAVQSLINLTYRVRNLWTVKHENRLPWVLSDRSLYEDPLWKCAILWSGRLCHLTIRTWSQCSHSRHVNTMGRLWQAKLLSLQDGEFSAVQGHVATSKNWTTKLRQSLLPCSPSGKSKELWLVDPWLCKVSLSSSKFPLLQLVYFDLQIPAIDKICWKHFRFSLDTHWRRLVFRAKFQADHCCKPNQGTCD